MRLEWRNETLDSRYSAEGVCGPERPVARAKERLC
jgi:hypothetical protein